MKIKLPTRIEIPAHLRADARAAVNNSGKMHIFLPIESQAIANIIETILPRSLEDFLKTSIIPLDTFVHESGEVARLRINLKDIVKKCGGLMKVQPNFRRTLLIHVLGEAIKKYYLLEIKSLDGKGKSYIATVECYLDTNPLFDNIPA